MRPGHGTGRWRCLPHVALAVVVLGNSGCLAAAAVGVAAAGGAAGYAYYMGSVPGEYHASFEQTWAAALLALDDLGLPLLRADQGDGHGVLESRTGTGEKVEISLEPLPVQVPAEGPAIRVKVRVGMFGEQRLSDHLLAQLQTHLAQPPQTMPLAPIPQGLPPDLPPQTAPPPLATPGQP